MDEENRSKAQETDLSPPGARTVESTRPPLRLWPGVLAVIVQWLTWFFAIDVIPGNMGVYTAALGLFLGGLTVLVWWAFFSRAPRSERWGAVVLVILVMAATPQVLHESVAKGNLGAQYFLFAIPALSFALVVWAALSRRLSVGPRWASMAATILVAGGVWALLRSDGLTGEGTAEFRWRWTQTPEEQLLARAGDEPMAALSSAPGVEAEADWPGFRGPNRDGSVSGVRIETDWSRRPPRELWRRAVGPSVSSFAVRGGLLYTLEQRGDEEIVACYKVTTGEPVWMHSDAARFWDSHVGAGPRASPALAEGRVYTLGATGILNALDADDGSVIWSRNAASDTGAKLPLWGFVSSPLVVQDAVIVHTNTLVAYDLASGDPRWFGPSKGVSNSSPHLATLEGVPQILMLSGDGVQSVAPTDGSLLWERPMSDGSIVQPGLTADGNLLIGLVDNDTAVPLGIRRFEVARKPDGWDLAERWTSRGLKPSFNQFVVHKGHAYGFDGRFLACIDLADGRRMWKGGRYGYGQLLLLPDQDVLLVLSESGEAALVKADPDGFAELGLFPAIEGKTWNQPALVGDILLVRNREEMAAFQLSLAREGRTGG